MFLGDGRGISVRVEVAFCQHVFQANPVSRFDKFDGRSFIAARLTFELFDHPHVVRVLVAVGRHLNNDRADTPSKSSVEGK